MQGNPIDELNEGLRGFKEELTTDAMAVKRVEIGIITFGGNVNTATEFTTTDAFHPPMLAASGDTPMGAAIEQGLELLKQRKDTYRANGISYYRPWVFLITDGGPTDSWSTAASLVHAGEAQKSFMFFAVGVQGANLDVLAKISSRQPLMLKGLRFRELFSWLSNSMGVVSRSQTADAPALTNPVSPNGWAVAG
jgi:uncharacterized protein YegL